MFAYGSDETLEVIAEKLAPGVLMHRHGSGFSAVVVDGRHATRAVAERLALDIALFDQRGCLSPRVALVVAGLLVGLAVALRLLMRPAAWRKRPCIAKKSASMVKRSRTRRSRSMPPATYAGWASHWRWSACVT